MGMSLCMGIDAAIPIICIDSYNILEMTYEKAIGNGKFKQKPLKLLSTWKED